ncbi:polysaccharide deacetylase family protein [Paenibacillus rigui]|uniref:Xylanase deacetylase n=1 Tax=Paenibacillus rigui TaxID=554312 RepID=A0A229UXE3_9BACL|nr:polysaccharide deacetylase family protein [Paenibacillus rigui]OXM88094.1 xylanase deacetylase [Paenibacillus rigui]
MNKKALYIASAALLLLIAACQNKDGAAPPPVSSPSAQQQTEKGDTSPQMNDTAPSQVPPDSKVQPIAAADSSANQAPAAQPASSDNKETVRQSASVPKLYKLNPKSYDIVPVDPSTTEKKVVLLTFDDGPKDHDMLESMLTTLDKHHAKAIFFVNGYRVKQKPELLKLILEHGQTIGNHSWDHIDLKKESKEKVAQQIDEVQKIVKDVTGITPQFFRPPFGSGSDEVRAKVKENQMLFMTWSNGSLDWDMTTKNNNPDKIVSNVLEQLRPGSNILMHELPWTDKALDKLLTELEAKQYGFVDPASIDITP